MLAAFVWDMWVRSCTCGSAVERCEALPELVGQRVVSAGWHAWSAMHGGRLIVEVQRGVASRSRRGRISRSMMDLLGMRSLALRVTYCGQVVIEGRHEYTICDNKEINFMTCIAGGGDINCLRSP